MAQLVKDYDFGFPLKNIEQLDDIERNILSDDKYGTSLVIFSFFIFHLHFVFIFQTITTIIKIVKLLLTINFLYQRKIFEMFTVNIGILHKCRQNNHNNLNIH